MMNDASLNVGGAPSAEPVPVGLSPPITPLKIKTLKICDFRAFAGPEPTTLTLDGKNLLVYGENGAGKSSIFHALNELFSVELSNPAARRERFEKLKNRFSGLPETAGFIEIELDDGNGAARWDHSRHPADITPTSDARVVNGAYRKAILDYRALLDTNYRHGSGEVNLFDVCVRVLLRDYPVIHAGQQLRLLDLWLRLEDLLTKKQLRAPQLALINELTASFNTGLREALDLLPSKVDRLLADLGWDDVKLTALTTDGVTYNNARSTERRAFNGKTVKPDLKFRNLPIPAPQTFLSEARLSALALAIYFAGRQVCAATLQADTPRLMVLDDVLIGLDQSNRLPVLQVLDNHFADWQIILLTYDRVWFEMARFHLDGRADWGTLELFEEIEPSGGSRPVLRVPNLDPVDSNLQTARAFHAAHQYPAAAVHARVAFELSLKKVCERKGIPVRFQSDPRKLTTEDLLRAIDDWLAAPARRAARTALAPAITNVRLWRRIVLNQFSHSTPVNLTANEVLGAINSVEALHMAFRAHLN